MRIEIFDGTTPLIQSIALVSEEVAFENMSKIGNRMRVNAGKKMNQQRHRHSWLTKASKNGKRTPYYSGSKQKNLGVRTKANGTTDNPRSMANMISSNLMEISGTLVVGGVNKGRTVIVRRDGERVGTSRLNSVSRHSQSIINKLDTGKRNEFHGWGSSGSKEKPMKGFEKARYIGRGFMSDGFRATIPYMKSELTESYEKTVGRAMNKTRTKVKTQKRTVA